MLQFSIIRPGTTSDLICYLNLAGIICEKLEVLCPADTGSYSVHHAVVYLDAIDFVRITYKHFKLSTVSCSILF